MHDERKPVAWCRSCELIVYEEGGDELEGLAEADWRCPQCENRITPVAKLSSSEKISLRAQVWFRELRRRGLHGFSPGGAANKLGCHRTMIDKLADMGVLEKSVYDRDGIFMVFISDRSIRRAMQSKRETGKWTKFRPENEAGDRI